jgi:hypothetical protein
VFGYRFNHVPLPPVPAHIRYLYHLSPFTRLPFGAETDQLVSVREHADNSLVVPKWWIAASAEDHDLPWLRAVTSLQRTGIEFGRPNSPTKRLSAMTLPRYQSVVEPQYSMSEASATHHGMSGAVLQTATPPSPGPLNEPSPETDNTSQAQDSQRDESLVQEILDVLRARVGDGTGVARQPARYGWSASDDTLQRQPATPTTSAVDSTAGLA